VVRHAVNDWLSFAQRLARNPRAVGAVGPSSAPLAQAMAAQIDAAVPGRILELGPGTGAITRALLARGVDPARIVAVEADAKFAHLLRERIPGIDVLEGDAMRADEIERLGPFAAVISSLPLLNFPDATVTAFVEAMLRLLPPGAPFVQYSYGVKPPVPRTATLKVRLAAKVWRNLPPARIWIYTAPAAAPAPPPVLAETGS
jgi:phosphatidylethanolamine/phosphatidyl-N-methylethanolamine N-methyltransferase